MPAPESVSAKKNPNETTNGDEESSFGRPAAASEKWCLAVGSYLYEDRAKQMAKKLAHRTKQIVRVVPDGRGSEKAYRILYGGYATESAAVRAADRLLARGIVSEAMVERIPE